MAEEAGGGAVKELGMNADKDKNSLYKCMKMSSNNKNF